MFISCLLLVSIKSYSVVHVINQTGLNFSPASLTVNVGDVIRWIWSSNSHTTTSKTIPAGAQTWDSPLNSTVTSFDYTVTVAGSYSYVCTFHETSGMVGSFTAVAATGIREMDLQNTISVFPNPAKSYINLKTSIGGEIQLSDILGKTIKKYKISELPIFDDTFRLDLSELKGGVYIISYLPINSRKRISVKFLKDK